jgi:hypothetical protein
MSGTSLIQILLCHSVRYLRIEGDFLGVDGIDNAMWHRSVPRLIIFLCLLSAHVGVLVRYFLTHDTGRT